MSGGCRKISLCGAMSGVGQLGEWGRARDVPLELVSPELKAGTMRSAPDPPCPLSHDF